VTDNTQTAAGPANFELGGGGIYNGEGATLELTDSTVSDNSSAVPTRRWHLRVLQQHDHHHPQHVSGNVSGDVAGGLRSPGRRHHRQQHVQRQQSTAWHGGGIFHTDGQLTVSNSTFSGNVAPAGTASGILVATFGAPAGATLTNNVLEGTRRRLRVRDRGRRGRDHHLGRRERDRRRFVQPRRRHRSVVDRCPARAPGRQRRADGSPTRCSPEPGDRRSGRGLPRHRSTWRGPSARWWL
jgi:hypothetical protein